MVHQLAAPLPTPPTSPCLEQHMQLEPHANHGPALHLLNDLVELVDFYQQERGWVINTRAALFELTIAADSSYEQRSASLEQSMLLPTPAEHDSGMPDVTIKSEPMDMDMSACDDHSRVTRNTRWMRRKNSMRLQLKLDGVSPAARGRSRRRRASAATTQQQQEPQPGEHGARLLQQFSELMDARIASCQRVSRLVQDASRQDLLSSR